MFNTDLGLQVANRKNLEDRARAAQWRQAREASVAARQRRRPAPAPVQPTGASTSGHGALAWRWAARALTRTVHPAG